MPVKNLNIFCYYNVQRFRQLGSMDCANWYGVSVPNTKKGQALYPAMGRRHINSFGVNRLIFNEEPRKIFKSINHWFVVTGTTISYVDKSYNVHALGTVRLDSNIWYATLPFGANVYTMVSDETNLYVISENGTTVTWTQVTDPNAPGGANTGGRPGYVAAFGNRFVVSVLNSTDYYISNIGLDPITTPSQWFSVDGVATFNRASGIIGQFAVLHAQLYIFCDFTTDVWSNIPSIFTNAGATTEFPFKLNTSYNFDYGIADPFSLSVDFGRMCWLARNTDGLITFMVSTGGNPEDMSSQAINVLLERNITQGQPDPFLNGTSNGFLYQYENSIFYRVVAGDYMDFGILDVQESANAIEFNFSTKTWHRVIEVNGERNRIQQHIYFNNQHLVTVADDPVVYEMAGRIYSNELRNKDAPPQATNAFTKYPMRYELITEQIYEEDYSEFITDYVEIDFVFGNETFYFNIAPFDNTVYIIDEASTPDNIIYLTTEESTVDAPVYIITEESNTPTELDNHYNALYKPHIELYVSDDGGVTFVTADLREFSPLGAYRWRMRFYELGASRNRCYKLVCVSSAPIVVLGAVQSVRRSSGGAN